MLDSLKKLEWLVKSCFLRYVLGLILSKEKRYCTQIASVFGISHDSIYRYLSKNIGLTAQFPDLMIKLAQYFHELNPGWLVVDDTALTKLYSEYIEGVHWVYNSSLRHPEMGLCIVVIAWTDGDIIIPIGFEWWFSKKIAPESYQKKIELAQKLIGELASKTNFRSLLADAGYISGPMVKFLKTLGFKFVARIPSSRKVTTRDGICEQMKSHPALKLNRNSRSKIVAVKIQDMEVNIVVFKRKKKRTCEYDTVFLVTNIGALATDIIEMYAIRWEIEPMFRTMKQSLGLMQCSAQALEKQALHVGTVFFSFAFIQYEKSRQNLSCSQDAIRQLQYLKIDSVISSFKRFCQDLCCVA